MILTEYDEKKHMKNVREEGRLEGKAEEKVLVLDLINCIIQDGQVPDTFRLKNDTEYYKEMLRKYNLD